MHPTLVIKISNKMDHGIDEIMSSSYCITLKQMTSALFEWEEDALEVNTI